MEATKQWNKTGTIEESQAFAKRASGVEAPRLAAKVQLGGSCM